MKCALLLTITAIFMLWAKTSKAQFNGISGCRTTKLDIIFIVDGSNADFQHNYGYVRQWIQNITSNFDVSPYTTRVAVVQSGDRPYTDFGFQDFTSTDEVLDAVNQLQFGTGTSTTADVLHYVKDNVVRSGRNDASIVVIMLTDGEIGRSDDVYYAAKQLHDLGVPTFAIGAAEILTSPQNIKLLKSAASDPIKDHLFTVQNLRNLGTLERSIIREVCKHTVQECPTASHDLAFIIDGSSTIGFQNFEKIKNWMKKIVEAFDVGVNKTRIAVMQYSTNVKEEISFNDGLSKTEVLERISRMRLLIGDTHTGYALEYCMNYIFSDTYGSRNNVPDVVIVMTDGKAQDHQHVVHAAKLVHDAGIEVYAMGVGASYSLEEIQVIASDPDENHILQASNFEQIDFQRTGLIKRICEESEPGCPNTVADIVFLVDNQVLLGEDNLQNVQAWMKSAVDYLEIGEHYSRIALVHYGALPELLFDLNEYSSTSGVLNAITRKLNIFNINPSEKSAASVAIDYVKATVFGHAGRNVPRFLLILSDGGSSDNVGLAVKRAENAGIKIFSFGVGEVNLSNLQALASSPKYVFHEQTFQDIRRRVGKLMSALCQVSEPACAIQEIDLQFLVDASENIPASDFDKVKRWIRNMIRSFDIGNYTTKIGLATYSSSVRSIFGMNTFNTKREIEHAVEMMEPMEGLPHTGKALEHVLAHSFINSAGSRRGVSKALVVLSDGESIDPIRDQVIKIHEAGIRVFAVGARSNTDREFLETLATEPINSHVAESVSYDAINTVRQQIVDEICRETKSECPEAEMDLIFLVDGSTAIGSESFSTVKNWLISFVSQFEIGEYNSKIGMIQYADRPRLEINLKKVSDKETLMKAILNVEHITGRSNVGTALHYVMEQGFSDKSNRRNTPKVVIVLTNGKSNDDWQQPALQLMNEGVIMYAVGVGDIQTDDIRSLASSDDNVLHVRNVDSIPTIHSSLVRRVCQKVQIECRENTTDIVVLIDGSYSVGYADWEVVKSFLTNITDRFEIGPKGVQLGVVQYATEPRIEFTLGDHDNLYDLQKAIRSIEWMMGDTHTARALRFARDNVMTAEAGARPHVSRILLVVTDGEPQDSSEVHAAAAAIREEGWRIFAIGVDEANLQELHVLASKPESDHVFYADDFESTRKLKGRLFRMICTERAIEESQRDKQIKETDPIFDPEFDVLSIENTRGKPTNPFDITDEEIPELTFDILPTFDTKDSKTPPGQKLNETSAAESDFNDDADAITDDHIALEAKELPTVDIDKKDLVSLPPLGALTDNTNDPTTATNSDAEVDFPTSETWPNDIVIDMAIENIPPLGDLKDLDNGTQRTAHPERPMSRSLITAQCQLVMRSGNENVRGWDYLKEMGITHPHTSEKPKRSILVNRFAERLSRRVTIRIKPGSSENLTSLYVVANMDSPRPLSSGFSDLFDDSWSFASVFRLHASTTETEWTLVNITDEDGRVVFGVNFNGANKTIEVELLRGDQRNNIQIHDKPVKNLYDRQFHKLELIVENATLSVRIDCIETRKYTLQGETPSALAPLTGTWVSSFGLGEGVVVNIQEIVFKCEATKEKGCCDIPGGQCGIDPLPLPRNSLVNDSTNCTCPPGPRGPAGPPGKTLQRGAPGKTGPRGPPGKSIPIKKATIRSIAKKVARTLIRDEVRKIHQVILNSIMDDGRMNPKVIEGVIAKLDRKSALKAAAGRPGSISPDEGDCEGEECLRVPDDLLSL